MFCTLVAWVCLVCLLLCKEERYSPMFFKITERRDMGLYEVPLSASLLGLGIGSMLANFHVYGIMLLLRTVLNIHMKNANPRGPICLGAWYLDCQVLVSCYFCFVLLPIRPEK